MKVKKFFIITALMLFSLASFAQTPVVSYLTIDEFPAGTITGTTTASLTVAVYFTNGDVTSKTIPISITNAGGIYPVTLPDVTANNINKVECTEYHIRISDISVRTSYSYMKFVQYATCTWGDDITFPIWH